MYIAVQNIAKYLALFLQLLSFSVIIFLRDTFSQCSAFDWHQLV